MAELSWGERERRGSQREREIQIRPSYYVPSTTTRIREKNDGDDDEMVTLATDSVVTLSKEAKNKLHCEKQSK